jgi:hypothetical protein
LGLVNGVPTPALTASLLGVLRLPGARGTALLNHVGGALIWSVRCEDGRFDTWVVHESLVLTPLLSRTASPVSALVELAGGRWAVAVGARILVVDAQSYTVITTLRGHRRGGIIWSLTPVSGGRLVSRSTDGTVWLWDISRSRALQSLDAGVCQGAEIGAEADDPEAVLLLTQPETHTPGVLTLIDLARGGRPRSSLCVVPEALGAVSCAAALRPGTAELVTAITPQGEAGASTTLSRWVNGAPEILCEVPTRRAGVPALNELFFPTPRRLMALGAKDAALVDLAAGTLRDDVRAYRVTSGGLALVAETELLDLNTGTRLVLPSGILRTPKVLAASSLAEDGASFALGAGDELVWWRLRR